MAKLQLVIPRLWPRAISALPAKQKQSLLNGLFLNKLSAAGVRLDPDWGTLLDDISGAPGAAHSAAICWLGESSGPAPNWICRADPIHMRTAGGGLIALPLTDSELTMTDAMELTPALNQYLEKSGYQLLVKAPDRWYLAGQNKLDLPVVPATTSLNGQFLDPGPFRDCQFAKAQRLRTELEMCLFEHPWNRQQEMTDKQTVNGIWLWGGSPGYNPAPVTTSFRVYADDILLRGCARAGKHNIEHLPKSLTSGCLEQCRTGVHTLFHIDFMFRNIQTGEQWREQTELFEQDWLGPAWQALRCGKISELILVDPDRLQLCCSHRQSNSWRRFIKSDSLLDSTG